MRARRTPRDERPMRETLRILLADDHPMFRRGLRNVVELIAGAEIVGEAATGADTIRLSATLQPDVVVMDLHMPDGDGIEATRQIVRDSPHVGVLILSMFGDDDSVFAAMRAGARGYLLKGADQAEISRAIAAIGAGEAIFGPSIAARVIDYFARPGRSMVSPASAFPELSDRELEVLELVAQGRDNAGHRPPTGRCTQDRPQPRQQRLHQAAGRRSGTGHRPCPRGRPGTHLSRPHGTSPP